MNQRHLMQRPDFRDTLALAAAPVGSRGGITRGDLDLFEQMADHDRADWALLRLVLCATLATLVLALASTLHG